jgi:uncharacterized membrane protein YccC
VQNPRSVDTSASTAAGPATIHPVRAAGDWLAQHDPGYAALRRAARAALVMPAMFALGDKVIGNPNVATFAAFGSFAMLLLVDFSGPIRDRLIDQSALGVTCAVLITLATLVSRTTWLAAVSMAVVAFAVLFAGVVSSVLAGATTSLLLSFILPVSLPAPMSVVGDRVAGWGLATGASLLAISLLWPAPARNPVRTGAIGACRALADRLRAEIAYALSGDDSEAREAHSAAIARANDAVQALQTVFFATPYRPTGLTTDARAVIRLVDDLRWLNTLVLKSAPAQHHGRPSREVCEVKRAAADVLEFSADVLERRRASSEELGETVGRMRRALADLERATTARLPADTLATAQATDQMGSARAIVSALDPSFRAQELYFVVGQIATNTEFAGAAGRRSWLERLLGRQPSGFVGPLTAAEERAAAHVERDSVWMQNSLRGAAALGLAVLVADLSSVQHGFWVVLAALSVLRTNTLSTGQNVVRALAGTVVGFIVGGVLVYLIGTDTTLLWILLPIVILFAGLAPAAISFSAGQAAFTLTLLILYNIIAPAGWKIGLVRVEDIAIGCAVSLAVGVLFWPRGAAPALGRALAGAYVGSARYLADAVAYGVGRCDPSGSQSPPPREQAAAAAAASRRLDVTFRGFLAERGTKHVALSDATRLVGGVAGVRLAADAVLDLWSRDRLDDGNRAAARLELMRGATQMMGWYERFAEGLSETGVIPDPLGPDEVADGRLVEAVAHDLRDAGGQTSAVGVRVIWTGDHLDAARRLQETLVEPARTATTARAEDPLNGFRAWARMVASRL